MESTRKSYLKNAPRNALFAALLCAGSVEAFWGVGDVVTDPGLTAVAAETKLQQAAQFVQSIANQIDQLQLAVRNTMALANPVFQPLGSILRTTQSMYWTGQSLMWRAQNLQNLDQQFAMMNPGYGGYMGYVNTMGRGGPTMESLYQKWSDQGSQTARSALIGAGAQIEDAESSQTALEKLTAQSSAVGGQLSALQAGNQIAAKQVEETQSLRVLLAQNTIMHAEKYAQDAARQSFYDASTQNFMRDEITSRPAKGY